MGYTPGSEWPGLQKSSNWKPLSRVTPRQPTNLSALRPPHSGSRLSIDDPPDPNPRDDERRALPFLVAEVSGRCAEPAATPCRTSGGARSVMRAQLLPRRLPQGPLAIPSSD